VVEEAGRARTDSSEAAAGMHAQNGNGNGNGHKNGNGRAPVEIYDLEKGLHRVWAFGELKGGRRYFGRREAIGAFNMLKEAASMGAEPDYIETTCALPEVSKFVTRGYRQKHLTNEKEVMDLDMAVIMVKPYLSRIAQFILDKKLKTVINYTWSVEDENNKKMEYDYIVDMFNDDHLAGIQSMKEVYEKKAGTNEEIINVCVRRKESINKLISGLNSSAEKSAEEKKRLSKYTYSLRKLDEKIGQNSEEAEDYKELAALYEGLLQYWMTVNYEAIPEKIDSMLKKEKIDSATLDFFIKNMKGASKKAVIEGIEKRYRAVQNALEKVDEEKDQRRTEKLENEAKELANLLKKTTYENIETEKKKISDELESRVKLAHIYTNQRPGDRNLVRIAEDISRKKIETHIKNAFGRRLQIKIYRKSHDLEVDGVGVRVVGNIFAAAPSYRKNYSKIIEGETNNMIGEGRNLKILIGLADARITYAAYPKKERGDLVYVITTSPFVDKNRIVELWKEGIGDPLVNMMKSGGLQTSSFVEAIFNKNNFFTEVHMDDVLMAYSREMREQRTVFMEKLNGFTPQHRIRKGSVDVKDVVSFNNKLPSEYNNDLMTKLLLYHDIDPYKKDEVSKVIKVLDTGVSDQDGGPARLLGWFNNMFEKEQAKAVRELNFVGVSDTHFGRMDEGKIPTDVLMEANRKHILKLVEALNMVITVLNTGDLVEGDYLNLMFNLNNDMSSGYEFRDMLRKKSKLDEGSAEYNDAIVNYEADKGVKKPDWELGGQLDTLFGEVGPLYGHPNTRAIITTSGHHVNGTPVKKMFPQILDEGRIMHTLLRRIYGEDKEIRSFYGGPENSRVFSLNELNMYVVHEFPDKSLNTYRPDAKVIVRGHEHIEGYTVVNDTLIYKLASLKGSDDFPRHFGSRTSEETRATSMFTIRYTAEEEDGSVNNKLVNFTSSYIRPNLLRTEGLIPQRNKYVELFEESKNRIDIPERMEPQKNKLRS
jgi:hypothetical protein